MSHNPSLDDRLQSCLLGLAIGDALGMPFEGYPSWVVGPVLDQIQGFHESSHRGLGAGQWTDDTQMTLCLARSLVRRGQAEPEDIAREYLGWFQSGDVRGIGATTLSAMTRLEGGAPWHESGTEGEYAAGNGAAMRAAPLGLLYHKDLEGLWKACALDAEITHKNAEAVAGSRAVAFLVARLVTGAIPGKELLEETIQFVAGSRVGDNLKRGLEFLGQRINPLEASEALGVGAYVVETVAWSAFCFFHAPDDFPRAVTAAVRAGGDTDTAGAITGALSGARVGVAGIPASWRKGVEAQNTIAALAQELYQVTLRRRG
ncbi:MAG: ADP-ribosylglycohydrolase family protein [Candidatus Methylomirabilales bacterium]